MLTPVPSALCAQVTATLDAPYADRHAEGSLRFNVEFSPMASPAFEPGWC